MDDALTAARLAGYGWDEINDHVDQASEAALAQGYTQDEVDAHKGYQPGLQDALNKEPQPPNIQPGTPDSPAPVPEGIPEAYAKAITDKTTQDPQHFMDALGETWNLDPLTKQQIGDQLPHPEDLIDGAIATVVKAGQGFWNSTANPADALLNDARGVMTGVRAVLNAKDNLIDWWAATGQPPFEAAKIDDPLIKDAMVQPTRPFSAEAYQKEAEEARPSMADLQAKNARDAIQETINPALLAIPGAGLGGMFLDPAVVGPFLKDLYNLPGQAIDYRDETEKLRLEGKDVSDRWKDDPGINFLLDQVVTMGAFKGAHLTMEAARATPAVLKDVSGGLKGDEPAKSFDQHMLDIYAEHLSKLTPEQIDRRDALKQEIAEMPKRKSARTPEQLTRQEEIAKIRQDEGLVIDYNDAIAEAKRRVAAPNAAEATGVDMMHDAVQNSVPRDHTGTGDMGRVIEAAGERAKEQEPDKLPKKPKAQDTLTEAPEDRASKTTIRVGNQKRTLDNATPDEIQKTYEDLRQAHTKEVHDVQAPTLNRSDVLSAYRKAQAELLAAGKGDAPRVRGTSSGWSKAMDDYDNAHEASKITSAYQGADEELRASAVGGARNAQPKERTTKPTSVEHVSDALDAYEAARVAARHEAADQEFRTSAAGGARNAQPTTRTSSGWSGAMESYDAAHEAAQDKKKADELKAQHQAADEELRTSAAGGAKNVKPKEFSSKPMSASRLLEAQQELDEARLDAQHRGADEELRASAAGGARNAQPSRRTSSVWMDEFAPPPDPRFVNLNAPGRSPIPTPPNVERPTVTKWVRELDNRLKLISRSASADLETSKRMLDAEDPQKLKPDLQKKIIREAEQRLGHDNPASVELSEDTKAFLDSHKALTDRQLELRRANFRLENEGKLTPEEMEAGVAAIKGIDHGVVRRMTREEAGMPTNLDPSIQQDQVTGVPPGKRTLSTYDPAKLDHGEFYMFEDPKTGERTWGNQPLKEAKFKLGDTVRDKDGNELVVKPARAEEIENHTDVRFRGNFLADLHQDVLQLGRINQNLRLMREVIPQMEKEGTFARQTGAYEHAPPHGMVAVDLPQFRGWTLPRIANVLNDFYQMAQNRGSLLPFFTRAGGMLTKTLFISPLKHLYNETAHFLPSLGAEAFKPFGRVTPGGPVAPLPGYIRMFKAIGTAMDEMTNWGPRYRQWVLNGGRSNWIGTTSGNLEQIIMGKYFHEVAADTTGLWGAVAKQLGLRDAPGLAGKYMKFMQQTLWAGGDGLAFARSIMHEMNGKSPLEAIHETFKDMPSYQIGTEVLGSHKLSEAMKSPLFMMFGRYRHGQIASLYNMARDLAGPARTPYERADAMAKFMLLGGMYYGMSQIGQYAGPATLIHSAWALLTGEKNWQQAVGSWVSLNPVWGIANSLLTNTDRYGKNIFRKGGDLTGNLVHAGEEALSHIYPGQLALKLMKGKGVDAALNFLGWDTHEPVDPAKKAKYDKRDLAETLSAERHDAIDAWVRNMLGEAPVPAAGTGFGTSRAGAGGGGRAATGGFMGSGNTGPRATGGYVGSGQPTGGQATGGYTGGGSSPANTGGARSGGRSYTPYARGRYYRGGSRRRR